MKDQDCEVSNLEFEETSNYFSSQNIENTGETSKIDVNNLLLKITKEYTIKIPNFNIESWVIYYFNNILIL